MFYYQYENNVIISEERYDLVEIDEEVAKEASHIFALSKMEQETSRKSFCPNNPSLLFLKKEDISLLKRSQSSSILPDWLIEKIEDEKVKSINTSYANWKEDLCFDKKKKWKVNIVGLGDVGGTLATGLRLLGTEEISSIGIYDIDPNKVTRWKAELGQILSPDLAVNHPKITQVIEDNLFDCDMFVFCVSVGVPEIGSSISDVRLAQFKGNSKIISQYARMARDKRFKGVFAIVSDPVDLLCKVAYEESNKSYDGNLDYMGLAPEQIRGYGLGVMNARAAYYAELKGESGLYLKSGRAFGPHGEGLIIANSVKNYNEELSAYLTEKTKKANIEIRKSGFKPYIAPALSSGSYSLLATIKGDWHYSCIFIGGTFWGCRNKLTNCGTVIETHEFNPVLFNLIEKSYTNLDELYSSYS